MNTDNFYSIDRLIEFGLGIGVAQQMVNSMNHALTNTHVPGAMNPVTRNAPERPPLALFVMMDGKQAGPFTDDEVTRLITAGTIDRTTFVWKHGMPKWMTAENVPEVLRLVALCPPKFQCDGSQS